MTEATAPYDGLFNAVVRRVRAGKTIFDQNVKLVLRSIAEDQWSHLKLPYLLVVPTVTRIEGGAGRVANDQSVESIINPRSITFMAQLDGRSTEQDWRAAIDIEIAERQLLGVLVNWRPAAWFRPTAYGGMRIDAARAPAVKVSFVFTFFEQIFFADDLDPAICASLAVPAEFPNFVVNPGPPPLEQVEIDPCFDPCDPCWPSLQWNPTDLPIVKGGK